jgi:nucleotide-binding universal stress UspA family protein
MAIKSILAAYTGGPASSGALRLALRLARDRGAWVTGVLAHGVARARTNLAPWLTAELDRMIAQQEQAIRADIEAKFWAEVGADRAKAAFLDVAGDPTASVMEIARTYDLVAMGRFEAEAGSEHFAPIPDVVALQSGRPVLICPPDPDLSATMARAVVAWDGKRAAGRAMNDALNLLAPGAAVTVVSIGEDEDYYRRDQRDPVEQLQRHGLAASFRLEPPGRRGVAETILGVCAEERAELLVMGAYEHSKFSEDLLGGVTARIFRDAPIPVMMAH